MKKKKLLIFDVMGYLALIALFAYLNITIFKNIEALIESDMSSELVLSNILAKEGRIMTTSWFYSTELKVLHNQLIFALLFKLTDNWHVVRMVGMIIVQLILSVSFFYFAKNLKLKHIPWIGLMFVGVSSRDYFKFVLLGSHYMPQIVISFFSFGLLLALYNETVKVKKIVYFVILNIIGFLAGLGGMRSVTVLQFPLLVTSFMFYFADEFQYLKEGKFNFKEKSVINVVICFVMCITCFVGVVFNIKIFPAMGYSYQMDGTTMFYQALNFDRIAEVINGWLSVLGYQWGDGTNILLTSKTQLVIKPLFIIFFVIACWSFIDVAINKEKYNKSEKFVFMYFVVSAVFISLLFVFTDKWYRDRYLLPISVFVPIIIGIFFSHYKFDWQKWILLSFIALFMFANTHFQIKYHMDNDSYVELVKVRDIILNNDCYNGWCTDHWNGHNILTELSDGKIETWRGSENFTSLWLQAKSHINSKPTGRCFFLVLKSQMDDVYFHEDVSSYLKYEDEQRVLYIFNSYDQLSELADW